MNDIAQLGSLGYSQIEPFFTECIKRRAQARRGLVIWWDRNREIFRYERDGEIANLSFKLIESVINASTVIALDFKNDIHDSGFTEEDFTDLRAFLGFDIENLLMGTLWGNQSESDRGDNLLGLVLVVNKNKEDHYNDS